MFTSHMKAQLMFSARSISYKKNSSVLITFFWPLNTRCPYFLFIYCYYIIYKYTTNNVDDNMIYLC